MRVRSRRFAGPRRATGWETGPLCNGTLTASSTGTLLSGTAVTVNFDGDTLVRTRGSMLINCSAAAAAGEGFFGAVGIIIVSPEAFAAGASAVPSPYSDSDYDGWLWHTFFHCLAGGAFSVNDRRLSRQIDIDSKAQRKLKVGEVICFVAEATEVGTSSLQIAADTRMLIKIP